MERTEKSKDQDDILVVIDGEPTTLRTIYPKEDTHHTLIHSSYIHKDL